MKPSDFESRDEAEQVYNDGSVIECTMQEAISLQTHNFTKRFYDLSHAIKFAAEKVSLDGADSYVVIRIRGRE